MGYQIITKMVYNARTRQIGTWQHSNNVRPRIDHFRALDVRTDEQLFRFITMVAEGSWQTRKWRKAFETLFREYPELRMDSYRDELKGKSWPEHCAVCLKYEELAGSKSPHEPQSAGANPIPLYIIGYCTTGLSSSSVHASFVLFVSRAFNIAFCLSIIALVWSMNMA